MSENNSNLLEIDQSFFWSLTAPEDTFAFSWDVGTGTLYYYRIEGKCIALNCTNSSIENIDPKCGNQTFFTVIAATDMADLCTKLKSQQFPITWPIKSIKKYSRPVYKTDIAIDNAAGIDHTCDVLEDIDFTQIPECIEFGLEVIGKTHIGVAFTLIQDFNSYTASGGLTLSGGEEDTLYESTAAITISGESVAEGDNSFTSSDAVVLSGSAEFISDNFTFITSGTITLSGTSGLPILSRYYYVTTGSLTLGGTPVVYVVLTTSGGVDLSGDADCDYTDITWHIGDYWYQNAFNIEFDAAFDSPNNNSDPIDPDYWISGGVALSGTADVLADYIEYVATGSVDLSGAVSEYTSDNFTYTNSGGLALSGLSVQFIAGGITSAGGITLSGAITSVFGLTLISSGSVVLSGNSVYTSPDWTYVSSGGGVVLDGTLVSNWLGILQVNIGSTSDNLLLRVDYPRDLYPDELPIVQDTIITDCGCNPSPLVVYLSHNINYSNNLSNFLNNNAFTLPSSVVLRYNSIDQVWRNSFYFKGIGSEDTLEEWKLLFEWGCSDNIGGIGLDKPVWKFSVRITRKLLTSLDDFETRLLYTFNGQTPCFGDQLLFGFVIDVRDGTIMSTSLPTVVETLIFSDEIGIFQGSYWASNPNLKLNVLENESTGTVETIDISPIFPTVPTLTA